MAITTEDMPPDYDHLGPLLHRIKLVFFEEKPAETRWITLVPGVPTVLGRDTLKTESAKVSKSHAVVSVDVVDGKACARIQNLATRSRTRVNNEELEVNEIRVLSDQDKIRMGTVVGVYETQLPELPFADEEDHGSTRSSSAIRYFDRGVASLAPLDRVILIVGAPGTGKERAAKQIHHLSGRKDKTLIIVNCAMLERGMAVGSLFGYKKGAFTGATTSSKGYFGAAEGSTIFLDEIGRLSLEVQGYLLRAIQDGYIQPLGETKERKVNVRVVAATSLDLDKLVATGEFIEDLRDRLGTPLRLPSLDQRCVDKLPLFHELWRDFHGASVRLTAEAVEMLLTESWDWNIRGMIDRLQLYSARELLTGPAVREMLDVELSYDEQKRKRATSHPPVPAAWTVEHALTIFKMKPSLTFLAKISGKSRDFFSRLLPERLRGMGRSDD